MIKKGHIFSTCISETDTEEICSEVTDSAFLPEFDGQIRKRMLLTSVLSWL